MAVDAGAGTRTGRDALITLAVGVSFAFIWSSAFTAAKFALASAPPTTLLTARFLASGVLAMVLARLLGQTLPSRTGQWARIAVLGICQNTLRSEEHTSELQSLMRISYADFCLKKKKTKKNNTK